MRIPYRRFKALLLGGICAFTAAFSVLPVQAEIDTSPLSNSVTVSTGAVSGSSSGGPSSGSSPSLSSGTGSDTGIAGATTANSTSTGNATTLWVVGDSTAAAFSDVTYYSPRYGWGTQLGNYFQGIQIRNLAISGTSSKSYSETDQYKSLLQNLKSGDYLMIAFGHNDERAESGRYTNPNGSYSTSGSFQYYLYEKYVKPARDHGATPILITPIVRRDAGNNYTGESGHITSDQTTAEGTFKGGDYAKAIQKLGVAKSVPVLDLTGRTRNVYEQLGAQGVKNRHAWTSSREASIDNTHTNLFGAMCNAWFIADELSKTSCSLKTYLVSDLRVPEYTDAALNANYHDQGFAAPNELSKFFTPSGEWKGTVFGDIDGYEYLNNHYFTLQPESDGSIHMAAGAGSTIEQKAFLGKIAQTTDGIAMYYQAVPANRNFTLSADVTINHMDANNQASFGLMVRDDVYLDTVLKDTLGDYVAAAPLMMGSSPVWNCFARKNGQLTQGGMLAKGYNAGDTVHVSIRKGPDGYTCQFGDNPPVSAGFDFPLTALDSQNVYAGMFVARSVDVTFRNVNLVLE
ncbi:MAG: GDSL-type esterase/lipase family protein [Lachnospiraceae bacterium]|nr:GDSL-type esterase/lipase family protein [Lachnospiraceae bacterium]